MRLTEEDARARLTAARVARLATTGADGQPHLVPVTFAVDGELIYVAVDHKPKTTVNLRRLRNIRENPRVAVLADHYAQDWDTLWWVRADGRASVTSAEDAIRRPLDLLAARYEQYRENRPEGPVIVIRVQRWTGWSSQSRLGSSQLEGTALPPYHHIRTSSPLTAKILEEERTCSTLFFHQEKSFQDNCLSLVFISG